MEKINLPPFYQYQKVVALSSINKIKKGEIYTVADVFQCPACKKWHVTLQEFYDAKGGVYNCSVNHGCYELIKPRVYYGGRLAIHFVPIEQTFIAISCEKVIEIENQLISAN